MQLSPAADSFASPDRKVPHWNETTFFSGCSPETGLGFFVHAGRCPTDLDLWWAQVAAYLPDGDIAVGYTWGRSATPEAITTGNLDVRIREPFGKWTIRYDGAAERTGTAALARSLVGSGAARPLRIDLEAAAAFPAWNMHNASSRGNADDWASTMHTQQSFRVTGRIVYDGVAHEFDGVGYNDHSRGVRTLSAFASDISLMAVFPEFAVHAIKVWGPDGGVQLDAGVMFTADAGETPLRVDFPLDTDACGNPRHVEARLTALDGTPIMIVAADALQVLPVIISEDNDNLTGIDWDRPGDPLVFIEAMAKLTTADGTTGFGNVERSQRRSRTVRP